MSDLVIANSKDKHLYDENPSAYENIQIKLRALSGQCRSYFSVLDICSGMDKNTTNAIVKHILDNASWARKVGRCYRFEYNQRQNSGAAIKAEKDAAAQEVKASFSLSELENEIRKSMEKQTKPNSGLYFSLFQIRAFITLDVTEKQLEGMLNRLDWVERNGKCYRLKDNSPKADKLACEHEYHLQRVDRPMWGKVGKRVYSCRKCNSTVEERVNSDGTIEHLFGEWTQKNGAGEIKRVCRICGYEEAKSVSTHEHVFGEWEPLKAADCMDEGSEARVCTLCGKTETRAIPRLGHDYDEWHTEQQASCEHDGIEVRHCKRCNYTDERVIAKFEHEYSEWTVVVEPSCLNSGLWLRQCKKCGASEERSIDKLPHKYSDWHIPEGEICTSANYEIRACRDCGYIEKRTNTHSEHSFGKWTTEKASSCTEEGAESRICDNCGYVEKRLLPKEEHEFGQWDVAVAPSCTEDGKAVKKCLKCGFAVERELSKTGHKYGVWSVKKAPGCEESGLEIRQCEQCGDVIEHNLSALGHNYSMWTVDEKPSATACGRMSRKCSRCEKCEERKFGEALEAAITNEDNDAADRKLTQLELIVESIRALGGTAKYADIYSEYEKQIGEALSADQKAGIRKAIESNSEDTQGICKTPLFYSVDGIGKGCWGLVESRKDTDAACNLVSEETTQEDKPGVDFSLHYNDTDETVSKKLKAITNILAERYSANKATSLTEVVSENEDIPVLYINSWAKRITGQTACQYLIDRGIISFSQSDRAKEEKIAKERQELQNYENVLKDRYKNRAAVSLKEVTSDNPGVPASRFSYLVKKFFGMTASRYLIEKGIMIAEAPAEDTAAKIEVAMQKIRNSFPDRKAKTLVEVANCDFGVTMVTLSNWVKSEYKCTISEYLTREGVLEPSKSKLSSIEERVKIVSELYRADLEKQRKNDPEYQNVETDEAESSVIIEEHCDRTISEEAAETIRTNEIDEGAVIKYLDELYPNKIIYRSQYNISYLSAYYYTVVRMLAKAENLSMDKWLQSKGFIFKNIGYVEPDMRQQEVERNGDDAFAIADFVFRKYPLAGLYRISSEEEAILYESASKAVQKLLRPGTSLSEKEGVIVTLETIELLKKWSPSGDEDKMNSAFWPFVYLQYGLKYDDFKQKIYKNLQEAIKATFSKYNRFFAPYKTKKYYTTMLMHAITPIQSTEALFSILFDFYDKNLDFRYIEDDISYSTLVKYLGDKWNGDQTAETDLQIKSEIVCSGLKTLFRHRPDYMATVCEGIVKRIDQTLKDEAPEAETYIEELFDKWYEKRSSNLKKSDRASRRQRSGESEFVATSEETITARYCLQNSAVGIEVLKIRLKDTTARPVISLYQDGREICKKDMSAAGNALSMTTKRCFIALEETDYDFAAPEHIRVIITQQDNTLFDSGKKLYREYLVFNESGLEKQKNADEILYLFIGSGDEAIFGKDDGYLCIPSEYGQLYKVNLNLAEAIFVNGTEITASEKAAKAVRITPGEYCLKGIQAMYQGKAYSVFNTDFSMEISLPDGEQPHRYYVLFDGKKLAADEYLNSDGGYKRIHSSDKKNEPHCVQIVDTATQYVKCELCYVIIPNFTIQYDSNLYFETDNEVSATIFVGDSNYAVSGRLDTSSDSFEFTCPLNKIEFVADVPVVRCEFLGKNAFLAEKKIWHKSIANTEFIKLELPSGWTGEVYLGEEAVPHAPVGSGYEIGNFIHSGKSFGDASQLQLLLRSDSGEKEELHIAEIAFVQNFCNPPVEYYDDAVKWFAEDNYIGDENDTFSVEVFTAEHVSVGSFNLDTSDSEMVFDEPLKHGRYSYVVHLITKKSVFPAEKKEKIYEGGFVVGNEFEFAFDFCELVLTNTSYWDLECGGYKSSAVRKDAAIIEDMVYKTHSVPNGYDEVGNMPQYEATLSHENSFDKRISFPDFIKDGVEKINPINVWIVNDHTLIMQNDSGEAVYFNTASQTVLKKDPKLLKKEKAITPYVYKHNICNPDYFEYSVREVRHV